MQTQIGNRLEELSSLLKSLRQGIDEYGLESTQVPLVELCLDEIVTNCILYGWDDPEDPDASIAVQAFINEEKQQLVIEVKDNGRPFDPTARIKLPDLNSPIEQRTLGGLGLYFVKTSMDRIEYQRKDPFNLLTLVKNIMPSYFRRHGPLALEERRRSQDNLFEDEPPFRNHWKHFE